jgi:hypothetical protein
VSQQSSYAATQASANVSQKTITADVYGCCIPTQPRIVVGFLLAGWPQPPLVKSVIDLTCLRVCRVLSAVRLAHFLSARRLDIFSA